MNWITRNAAVYASRSKKQLELRVWCALRNTSGHWPMADAIGVLVSRLGYDPKYARQLLKRGHCGTWGAEGAAAAGKYWCWGAKGVWLVGKENLPEAGPEEDGPAGKRQLIALPDDIGDYRTFKAWCWGAAFGDKRYRCLGVEAEFHERASRPMPRKVIREALGGGCVVTQLKREKLLGDSFEKRYNYTETGVKAPEGERGVGRWRVDSRGFYIEQVGNSYANYGVIEGGKLRARPARYEAAERRKRYYTSWTRALHSEHDDPVCYRASGVYQGRYGEAPCQVWSRRDFGQGVLKMYEEGVF